VKVKRSFFSAALLSLAAIGGVFLMLSPVVAQRNSMVRMWGVPDDWTHHHLIFSDPGSFADAVNHGSFERWYKVVTDPRFVIQQAKRAGRGTGIDGERRGRRRKSPLHNDWTMSLGSGGIVGAGQYPAKFPFGTATSCANDFVVYNTGLAGSSSQPTITAYSNLYSSCSGSVPSVSTNCANNFVVYNTGLAGSSSQPTIIAYSNLYSSCSGSVPSVYWQYNTAYPQGSATGDGSAITTSVVLSSTGAQLAFVQNNSSNVASLVLLKWQSSSSLVQMDTGTNNVTPSNYPTCTAPCMTRLSFNGSANDTNSPPFYDYADDIMYVGDNSGKLHKFTGVFLGTPAEVTVLWPIAVSSNVLTGPVYDSGTKHIVADCGQLERTYRPCVRFRNQAHLRRRLRGLSLLVHDSRRRRHEKQPTRGDWQQRHCRRPAGRFQHRIRICFCR